MDRIENNVGRLRTARGLNQTQLAELCGTTQPHISRIESGDPGVRIEKYALIAAALKVTIADLFAPDRAKAEEILIEAFRRLPRARQQGWLDMARAIQLEASEGDRGGDQTADQEADG